MTVSVSEFELKVLRAIAKRRMPEGNKAVHVSAAARRLEKKGLALKTYNWYVTDAGEKYLASLSSAEAKK